MNDHHTCLHLHICTIAWDSGHEFLLYNIFYYSSSTIYNLWSALFVQRATSPNEPSLTRSGTILLELKRRYVSQRLSELQDSLGQMRQSQQHESKSKNGTRARTQSDSITDQRGEPERHPGAHGCSSADVQQLDSISAGRSHSQHGNSKLESHISEQQRGATVHSSNPDALQDNMMVESQQHGDAPGNLQLRDQITIESTTGHTNPDDKGVDWSESRLI